MIKIENLEIMNIEGAIRGMRNPRQSHKKSDSFYTNDHVYVIGPNDLSLAYKLLKMKTADERKFMRQILVCMDITAPIYWWKDFDQYKIGTVTNGQALNHTICCKGFKEDDFETDEMTEEDLSRLDYDIKYINRLCCEYQKYKNIDTYRRIMKMIPQSFCQTRTWTGNFENLRNIYFARRNHILKEFRDYCKFIEELPYSELITYAED